MAEELKRGIPVDFTKSIDRSLIKGRTALVTGGASGIGFAIATALVESGAIVTIADVNEEHGSKAEEELKQHAGTIQFVKTNVTSWEDQVNAFSIAAKGSADNTVDIVVTAAGIRPLLETITHPSKQDAPIKPPTGTLEVNLIGTYYSMALALWYFSHSPSNPAKQILFISSMAGYASSNLRRQSQYHGGARFNLLAPTFIDTPLLRREEVQQLKEKGTKVGTTADVVDGAMRCLCDVEVSGRAVIICGGEANGGEPGSANFDACDEAPGMLGGRALWENLSKFFGRP